MNHFDRKPLNATALSGILLRHPISSRHDNYSVLRHHSSTAPEWCFAVALEHRFTRGLTAGTVSGVCKASCAENRHKRGG